MNVCMHACCDGGGGGLDAACAADAREPGGGWADVGEASPSATTPSTLPGPPTSPRGASFKRTVPCLLPERDQARAAFPPSAPLHRSKTPAG